MNVFILVLQSIDGEERERERERELAALLNFYSWCQMIVVWLFLVVPCHGFAAVCDCGIS